MWVVGGWFDFVGFVGLLVVLLGGMFVFGFVFVWFCWVVLLVWFGFGCLGW